MHVIIGWLVNALRTLFASRLGAWFAGALAWLGLSFGVQKVAVEPAIDQLRGYMDGLGGAGQLAADAVAWAGVMNFDIAVTMLMSAIAIRRGIAAGRVFLKRRG